MFMKVQLRRWGSWTKTVDVAALAALFPMPDDFAREEDGSLPYFEGEALIPAENVAKLVDLGVDLEIRPTVGNLFVSAVNKTFSRAGYGPAEAESVTTLHIPNEYLFRINDVKVLDDACTDSLQAELDDGWRIICVCPPNSQRRPDYVLGRVVLK